MVDLVGMLKHCTLWSARTFEAYNLILGLIHSTSRQLLDYLYIEYCSDQRYQLLFLPGINIFCDSNPSAGYPQLSLNTLSYSLCLIGDRRN